MLTAAHLESKGLQPKAPPTEGYHVGVPPKKDCNTLGSSWGPPILGNYIPNRPL